MRSHYCGQVNESLIGQEIGVAGWVHRRRDHGGVIFVDLRDREGLLQIVFDPDRKDGRAARGIAGQPDKSNWALRLEDPPFMAFAVTGGITFAFGGVKTDAAARVIDTRGAVIPGLYAAGEPQGEFYFHNYPGATGVLRGCVFGRLAARDALARRGV